MDFRPPLPLRMLLGLLVHMHKYLQFLDPPLVLDHLHHQIHQWELKIHCCVMIRRRRHHKLQKIQ